MSPDEKLETISNLISDYRASGRDLLVSTQKLLNTIQSLAGNDVEEETVQRRLEDPDDHIIISTDASITQNPGGLAAIGVVIQFPDSKMEDIYLSKTTTSNTNNEAEYDAIYEGILSLANLKNSLGFPVLVRSDSKLAVKQLTKEYNINDEVLKRKNESIHELCASLPVPVIIEWLPRNSTPALTRANYLAQDAIGVPRH